MPDADDFDVEELRRLLKGEGARPEKPAVPARDTKAPKPAAGARKRRPPKVDGGKAAAARKRR